MFIVNTFVKHELPEIIQLEKKVKIVESNAGTLYQGILIMIYLQSYFNILFILFTLEHYLGQLVAVYIPREQNPTLEQLDNFKREIRIMRY